MGVLAGRGGPVLLLSVAEAAGGCGRDGASGLPLFADGGDGRGGPFLPVEGLLPFCVACLLLTECSRPCNAFWSSDDTLSVLPVDEDGLSAEVLRVGGGGFGRLAVLVGVGEAAKLLAAGLGLTGEAVFLLGAGCGGLSVPLIVLVFSSAVKLASKFSVDFLRNFF